MKCEGKIWLESKYAVALRPNSKILKVFFLNLKTGRYKTTPPKVPHILPLPTIVA